MADIKTRFLLFAFLFVVFSGVTEAYKYCNRNNWSFTTYNKCRDDQYCCGQGGVHKCCSYDAIITGGAIAGMVIGGMFVCGLIFACICICVQKSKAKQGVVIHPANHAHVAFVSTSGYTQQMSSAYGPPGQNNMYGGPTGPPNMYGGQPVAPPPYAEPQAAYPPNAPPPGFQTQT